MCGVNKIITQYCQMWQGYSVIKVKVSFGAVVKVETDLYSAYQVYH